MLLGVVDSSVFQKYSNAGEDPDLTASYLPSAQHQSAAPRLPMMARAGHLHRSPSSRLVVVMSSQKRAPSQQWDPANQQHSISNRID